ncbi:hypothetical protein HID58_061306 [Brassica napus]|uniref:Uncharacterized protein n=1 Tax=Brassica napus TaxID=3708 RepID=A0ABQ7ZY78_BRANA|nr:hypothetical protein HID58_061306 [Brassica napus]
MVLNNIQSSNAGKSQGILSGSDPKLSQTRREGLHLQLKHKSLRILVAELLQQRIASSEETDGSFSCHLDFTLSSAPLPDKPASQMAKAIVQSIGIELIEQVTERVIWTAMEQATESIAKAIAEVQAVTGEVNNNYRRVCLYQLQSLLVFRAYKVSVNGGMKFAVEEADMTA